MMNSVMLTTEDNPFDPFDQFEEWFQFDIARGYNTCAYIARVAVTSSDISLPDQHVAIEAAIDEILDYNLPGNYLKVFRKDSDS
jgi:hypothetical protein